MCNSIYIHIPFCKNICSYCDFCKIYYDEDICSKYLDALKKEVLDRYKNEEIYTLYIGGGTPSSLSIDNIKQLFDVVRLFKLDKLKEFTFEFNVQDMDEYKLSFLKDNKVNRLSIGVQTINKDGQILLKRECSKEEIEEKVKLARKYFDNINIDLIYAYPNENMDILKEDLDFITGLDPEHISCYSLIIEDHTVIGNSNIEYIDDELDLNMYEYIRKYLKDMGYNHIEVSNYSKEGYEPLHNLVYWTNNHYYGFGAGASGYIDKIRYTNTKSVFKYIDGDYKYEESVLEEKDIIENEMILGLRLIKGIDKKEFYNKYNKNIEDVYDIKKLIKDGLLIDDGNRIYIPEDKIYVSNSILINFIGE